MIQATLGALLFVLLTLSPCAAGAQACPCAPAQAAAACICPSVDVAQLDLRLAQLRDERARAGLGGPITLMAIGYGGAALLGFVELGAYFISWTQSDDSAHRDHAADRRWERNMGIAELGMTAVGGGGTWWLVRRIHERRRCTLEMRALEQRRLQLAPQLGPQSFGVSMRGTF